MHTDAVATNPRHGWVHRVLRALDRWLHPVVRCDVCGADIRIERASRRPGDAIATQPHDPISQP